MLGNWVRVEEGGDRKEKEQEWFSTTDSGGSDGDGQAIVAPVIQQRGDMGSGGRHCAWVCGGSCMNGKSSRKGVIRTSVTKKSFSVEEGSEKRVESARKKDSAWSGNGGVYWENFKLEGL